MTVAPPQPDNLAVVTAENGAALGFADRARDLASVGRGWAAGCLVEGPDGLLVSHRLDMGMHVPVPVAAAVLTGNVQPLDCVLLGRRTLGLISSGAVMFAAVPGTSLTAVRLPLRMSTTSVGAVWLLLEGEPPSLVELEAVATRTTMLLVQAAPALPLLMWCLDGHPDAHLPDGLAECTSVWVVALIASGSELPTHLLERAKTAGLQGESCGHSLTSYVVLGGGSRSRTAAVQRLLRSVLAGDPRTRAGLSAASAATSLPTARRQAELALRIAGPGELVSLEEDRSALVLRHLADGFATLPDLGPDPLEQLRAYDTLRSTQLTWTLDRWLGSGKDVAATTAALSIHTNTLRYRLQRIDQVLGVDLRRDTATTLELQLRLLAESQAPGGHPQLSRSTTSTGS